MTAVLAVGGPAWAQTVVLDDFESATIREINPNETDPTLRLLFNQYENGTLTPGTESTETITARNGSRSLRVRVNTGNLYLQFYTHNGNFWQYLRTLLSEGTWQFDTFNRMRIWLRVPSNLASAGPGQQNMEFGTYYRATTGNPVSAEDGGDHFYHFFNIPYSGQWHQLIIDSHPNHIRGQVGGTEWGDRPYPTNEPGFNYFDLMTRFYMDFHRGGSNLPGPLPADFYIDRIELYRETNTENVDQVYSLNGVWVPGENRVRVGWMRRKDQDNTNHEVRYAFQDIHALGFANATFAQNVAPDNGGAYNGMSWTNTGINVSGQSTLYVAIRPVGAETFRQIAIPLGNTDSTVPAPPTNLRVVP